MSMWRMRLIADVQICGLLINRGSAIYRLISNLKITDLSSSSAGAAEPAPGGRRHFVDLLPLDWAGEGSTMPCARRSPRGTFTGASVKLSS